MLFLYLMQSTSHVGVPGVDVNGDVAEIAVLQPSGVGWRGSGLNGIGLDALSSGTLFVRAPGDMGLPCRWLVWKRNVAKRTMDPRRSLEDLLVLGTFQVAAVR